MLNDNKVTLVILLQIDHSNEYWPLDRPNEFGCNSDFYFKFYGWSGEKTSYSDFVPEREST